MSISSTLSCIHLESRPRNIPKNLPKSLPHNIHNASSIHSPLPSCCCRQESRTSSATRTNVKISFLTRIPMIESIAKILPVCDEHQLHIGRRLAGDQHPMMVLKKTPQQLCLPQPPSTCFAHFPLCRAHAPTGGRRQDRITAGYRKLPISPTNSLCEVVVEAGDSQVCILRSN